MNYSLGLVGMWLFSDGLFSISLYHRWNPTRIQQSWVYDHSIRLLRMAIGIYLMVVGYE